MIFLKGVEENQGFLYLAKKGLKMQIGGIFAIFPEISIVKR